MFVAVGAGLGLLLPVLASAMPVPVTAFAPPQTAGILLQESLQAGRSPRGDLVSAARAVLQPHGSAVRGQAGLRLSEGGEVGATSPNALYSSVSEPAENDSSRWPRPRSGPEIERERESDGPSAVPLPAPVWLLAGGLALLALNRRRLAG